MTRLRLPAWPVAGAWPVACAWSIAYAVLGAGWAAYGAAFPFGAADDRAADMGSLLATATPGPTGLITTALGVVGAVVAPAMSRVHRSSIVRAALLAYAWSTCALLVLIVPDGRVLIHLAYALMGNVRGLDWTVLNQLACIVGGLAWARVAIGYRRPAGVHRPAPTWGRTVTYVAVVLPLIYAATRLAWALGLTIGFADAAYLAAPQRRTTELILAGMAVTGSLLTLGLAQRWGRVFPGWVPLLARKRVPPALAIAPALLAATVLTLGGLILWRGLLAWVLGLSPDSEVFDTANWAAWLGNLTFLPWGLALTAATYAYYRTTVVTNREARAAGSHLA